MLGRHVVSWCTPRGRWGSNKQAKTFLSFYTYIEVTPPPHPQPDTMEESNFSLYTYYKNIGDYHLVGSIHQRVYIDDLSCGHALKKRGYGGWEYVL